MDYNSYEDVLWQYKTTKVELPSDPKVDTTEKYHDGFTDISEDTLLVAKQFMVFAHLRCPKPPIRYARGLLQSTIRVEPTYYLGMNGCICKCGNAQAFYMPFTNEEWHSAKAYPVGSEGRKRYNNFAKDIRRNYEASKRLGDTRSFEEYEKDAMGYYKNTIGFGDIPSLVRKNPNEHWWDKAIQDTVNLCQERGVMMNG